MVEPNLLSITTVPIKVELNIIKGEMRNPRVNNPDAAFKMDIETQNGDLQIHSEPMKIHIDTYAARSSLGYGNYNNLDLFKKKARRASVSLTRERQESPATETSSPAALPRRRSPRSITAPGRRSRPLWNSCPKRART